MIMSALNVPRHGEAAPTISATDQLPRDVSMVAVTSPARATASRAQPGVFRGDTSTHPGSTWTIRKYNRSETLTTRFPTPRAPSSAPARKVRVSPRALELGMAHLLGSHGACRGSGDTILSSSPRLWLFPKSIELPTALAAGGRVPLALVMENRGVAPPYAPYELRVKLSGAGGQVIKVLGAGGISWLPGAPVASQYEFSLPADLKPDEYQLAIGLFDRSGSQERPVEFGLKASLRDREGFYQLTKVPVTPAHASDSRAIGTSRLRMAGTGHPPEFQRCDQQIPSKASASYKNGRLRARERKNTSSGTTSRVCADDSVERIIAHTNRSPKTKGNRFEDLNVKSFARVSRLGWVIWKAGTGPPTCTPSTTTARLFRRG